MTRQAVVSLDEYRAANGIELLMNQVWPANRVKGDFRAERKAVAELELRTTICGWCGECSPELNGPAGRAWFSAHTTNGSCSQRVIV